MKTNLNFHLQLKTKKRIAFEVLAFFCAIIIAFISYLLIFPYNSYQLSKYRKTLSIIESKSEQVNQLAIKSNMRYSAVGRYVDRWLHAYKIRQDRFHDDIKKDPVNLHDSFYNNLDKVWEEDLVIRASFHDRESFMNSFSEDKWSEEEINRQAKISKLEDEISKLVTENYVFKHKILSPEEQYDISFNVLLFVLIILYPIRLLFLLIKWSVITLKQKND